MAELRPNMFELVWDELGTFVKKKLGSEKTPPLTTICDNCIKDRARFTHTENTLTVSSVFGH